MPSSLSFVVPLYFIWAHKYRDREPFYGYIIYHSESCFSEISALEKEILVFFWCEEQMCSLPSLGKRHENYPTVMRRSTLVKAA